MQKRGVEKRHQHQRKMTIFMLFLSYLVATVASVPTSVLAQNSEVTSNMMHLNMNKQNLQKANNLLINSNSNSNNNNNTDTNLNNMNINNNLEDDNTLMAKVKRSSSSSEPMTSSMNMANSGLDKKSSPEVLPPAFNMPMVSSSNQQQQEELIQQQQLQQLQHQQPQLNDLNQQSGQTQPITNTIYTLPTNSEIMAAVEAAAAAAALNQRDAEQRQAQYYGAADDAFDAQDYPVQPHKRGIINTPQYYYDGLANSYGVGSSGNPGNLYSANVPNDYYNPYMSLGTSNGGAGASGLGGMGGMPAGTIGNVGLGYGNLNTAAMLPSNDIGLLSVPNGYWSDDDSNVLYPDIQDVNEYAPMPRGAVNYRNKAYDNLQNILNSEANLESAGAAAAAPLPIQYTPSRYYGSLDADHGKRSKFSNRYADYRLKRDTKLTPADMLALVALVEAGERARQDDDSNNNNNNNYNNNNNNNLNNDEDARFQQYDYNNNNNMLNSMNSMNNMNANMKNPYDIYAPMAGETYDTYGANWYEPMNTKANLNANANPMDLYGMANNMEALPKYENKFNYNPYEPTNENLGSKRYMIAKRKRSMGKLLKEPIGKVNVGYNGDKYF